MPIWKGICTCVGCAAAIGICIASAGMATPFIAASATPWIIGGGAIGGFLLGDKADKESAEREKMLLQDQRYKDAKDAEDKQANENNQNRNLINEILGKLNGSIPKKPGETDESLNQQLVAAQSDIKRGGGRLGELRKATDKLRQELTGGDSLLKLLGLDKLSFAEKVLIVGGIVGVIWLLKG